MEGPEWSGQPDGDGQTGRKPLQPPNSVRHAGATRRRAPEAPERITGAEPCGTVRDSSETRRTLDATPETRVRRAGLPADCSHRRPGRCGGFGLRDGQGGQPDTGGSLVRQFVPVRPTDFDLAGRPGRHPGYRGQRTSCSSELEASLHDENARVPGVATRQAGEAGRGANPMSGSGPSGPRAGKGATRRGGVKPRGRNVPGEANPGEADLVGCVAEGAQNPRRGSRGLRAEGALAAGTLRGRPSLWEWFRTFGSGRAGRRNAPRSWKRRGGCGGTQHPARPIGCAPRGRETL